MKLSASYNLIPNSNTLLPISILELPEVSIPQPPPSNSVALKKLSSRIISYEDIIFNSDKPLPSKSLLDKSASLIDCT